MSDQVSQIITKAYSEGRQFLLEPEANEVCKIYGLPVAKIKVATSPEMAVQCFEEMGTPVVLKIVSPDILHKSDAGGVIVGLNNANAVRESYQKIMENVRKYKPDANIIGILVQEMAPQSTEVIVGMTNDPTFGPTIMFGLGGIFVEVLKDVSFRIAPIKREDAYEMIKEIKSFKILTGARGREPADLDALADVLLGVSKLVTERNEIASLDLNPVFAYAKGAKVVDTRIILAKK
jgi:acetyl-CoA synthetase (ADP-forming)